MNGLNHTQKVGKNDGNRFFSGYKEGALDIAGRFIRAGLPAPRQLILDNGKDLDEFYIESKSQGVQ